MKTIKVDGKDCKVVTKVASALKAAEIIESEKLQEKPVQSALVHIWCMLHPDDRPNDWKALGDTLEMSELKDASAFIERTMGGEEGKKIQSS